jgi:hypothetical protein
MRQKQNASPEDEQRQTLRRWAAFLGESYNHLVRILRDEPSVTPADVLPAFASLGTLSSALASGETSCLEDEAYRYYRIENSIYAKIVLAQAERRRARAETMRQVFRRAAAARAGAASGDSPEREQDREN